MITDLRRRRTREKPVPGLLDGTLFAD